MSVGAERHTGTTRSVTLEFEGFPPRGGVPYQHQPIRSGRGQAATIRAEGIGTPHPALQNRHLPGDVSSIRHRRKQKSRAGPGILRAEATSSVPRHPRESQDGEPPMIPTTVVGSYPVPAWLRVYNTRESLRDAMLVVLKTQELPHPRRAPPFKTNCLGNGLFRRRADRCH